MEISEGKRVGISLENGIVATGTIVRRDHLLRDKNDSNIFTKDKDMVWVYFDEDLDQKKSTRAIAGAMMPVYIEYLVEI